MFACVKPISLGIIRSDVMLESLRDGIRLNPRCRWKQVEINTIASGFGWLGPASRIIHRLDNEN